MDWTTAYILAVIFLATVVRSGFGFGEALVAVPLLALIETMSVEVATPLAVLVSITVAVVVLLEDWRKVHFRIALVLVISTFFGIPLGLLLLTRVDQSVVKAILACAIIAFALFCLLFRGRLELQDDRFAWIFGFLAGILGGAYGVNGPPLIVYGSLRRWTPEQFRATLQGYFLPASLAQMLGYWRANLWVREVNWYFLVTLPAAAAAIFVGRWISRRLKAESFIFYIHIGLIVVGVILLVQSVGSMAIRAP